MELNAEKYRESNTWRNIFERLGYTEVDPEIEWDLEELSHERGWESRFTWYRNDQILIGFRFPRQFKNTIVEMVFRIRHTAKLWKLGTKHGYKFERAIYAFSKENLIPTCMDLKWMSELVEESVKN